MKTRILVFLLALCVLPLMVRAQLSDTLEEQTGLQAQLSALSDRVDRLRPGESRFLLRGYAHSGLQLAGEQFSFVGGSFNPLLLYRQSDRLLFESELEFELEGTEVLVSVEYANISYLLSPTLTFRAGKFLIPFGIFTANLHPAWINRLPTVPLGIGHDGIVPSSDIGLELRGSAYLHNFKFNYSIYAVNGAQLDDGSLDPAGAGTLIHARFPDNNRGKTLGGRLGLFPFANSSMELGLSAMYGQVGTAGTEFEAVRALHYALDFSYVKTLYGMGSVLDLKAQYVAVQVDRAAYPDHENPDQTLAFDNRSMAWYAQLSFRPALVAQPFVRNLEFVGRLSRLQTPAEAEWAADQRQIDLGVNYWIDWRTLCKFSYRIMSGQAAEEDPGHGEAVAGNAFFVHWAIGF